MKYLIAPNGSPLTFPPLGGDTFVAFDGTRHATGKVAETTEAYLKREAAKALPSRERENADDFGVKIDPNHPFNFCEVADLMRDMRWIAKALAREQVEVGAEGIGMKASGRGVSLSVPASAKPQVAAYIPKVGDRIAVGANISPKALMNARGEVTAVNGTKVTVRLSDGDRRRYEAATGKAMSATVNLPKVCVEADA